MRVGEASHPGPELAWVATEQPWRDRTASCRSCGQAFAPGEARVMSQQAQLRQRKHHHPQCIAGGLGQLDDIRGFSELSEAAQQNVMEFADTAQASRAQYMAAKRRRTEPSKRDLGEASELQVEEELDPDGAFLDDRLLHME